MLRVLVVAASFLSWLVLANHCALASLAEKPTPAEEHACCPNNAPAKPDPAPAPAAVACCKSLHALSPDAPKVVPPSPVLWLVALLGDWLEREIPHPAPVLVAAFEGPPPATTFEELVLHRSLQSHAPPCLLA